MAEEIVDPRWRQLCELALSEPDPEKLLEKVAEARNAILDCIEDGREENLEGTALRAALGTLSRLQKVAMSKMQTGASTASARKLTT